MSTIDDQNSTPARSTPPPAPRRRWFLTAVSALVAGVTLIPNPPAAVAAETAISPIADARVSQIYPSSNYGTRAELRVRDDSLDHWSYVKFDVRGLTGPASARLRLFVTDGSTDGGTVSQVHTWWTESGITWANGPRPTTAPIARIGSVTTGSWVEIPLGQAIRGNGHVAFLISGGSSNSAYYSSREAINKPKLIVSPSSTSTVAPPTTARAESRPVGSPVLSDTEATARVRRSSWEPRPENAVQNRTKPTADELAAFRRSHPEALMQHVSGNFTGTTDEIIQWAAHKWGIDEDVVRSVAVAESYWKMSAVGDNGESFGLMQVRFKYHPDTEVAARSTAFNVDYWAAVQRYYYEGHGTWLHTVDGNGATYGAGDFWGSIGAWFSGRWRDQGALGYIQKIQQHVAEKPWTRAGF